MRRLGIALSFGLLTVAVARSAEASSVLEVPDNGSEQMGRGGAWVARASDPLATAFNPAGLAGQASRVTLQSNILFQHTCFARVLAASDTSLDPLASGGVFPRVCNDIEPAFNPQIGATIRVSDRLGIGLLLVAPAIAGAKSWPEFVPDGAGGRAAAPQRYLLTRQSGVLVFPTLGIGYEVLPNLRLGLSFGWGIAKLKTSAATVALNSNGQTPDNDVQANLQVRDYFIPRIGVGGLWSVAPNLDLAAWYQWTDALRAVGDTGTATSYYGAANARGDDSRVGYGDTIFGDCGTGRTGDAGKCGGGDNARVQLALPMEAKLGVRYHAPRSAAGVSFARDPLANDRFDAELDFTWANNSAIDALQIRFPGDASGAGRLPVSGINAQIPPNGDQPRHYRDVLGVRVGGDYNVLPDRLALRAGAYYETSAARAEFQNIDFAASQRFGFAFGATYRVRLGDLRQSDALEFMVGYGHTFFADQTRTDRNATGSGALAGSSCLGNATVVEPNRCSDGTQRYRTPWPVNLGTVTNALNVVNVGVAYRF